MLCLRIMPRRTVAVNPTASSVPNLGQHEVAESLPCLSTAAAAGGGNTTPPTMPWFCTRTGKMEIRTWWNWRQLRR